MFPTIAVTIPMSAFHFSVVNPPWPPGNGNVPLSGPELDEGRKAMVALADEASMPYVGEPATRGA